MRSDDLWTGEISKNTLTDETIWLIKLINTCGRSVTYELSTNKHTLLSNIELRTMNEESNSDAGLRIIESEVELEERRILGGGNLIEEINVVMLTDVKPNENILENEVLIPKEDSQSPKNLK